jgi:hypothetical protein
VRSRLGYLFGVALCVFAGIVAIVAFTTATATMANLQRVAMPGRADITLPSGPSTLYAEHRSRLLDPDRAIDGPAAQVVRCAIEDPGAYGIHVGPAAPVDYDLAGYAGRSVYDVVSRDGGRFTLACEAAQPFVIAIGSGLGSWKVVAVIAIVPLVAGLALLATTAWRRRALRRAPPRATA